MLNLFKKPSTKGLKIRELKEKILFWEAYYDEAASGEELVNVRIRIHKLYGQLKELEESK